MISFKNKNILITGATGGIGNALIKKFILLGGNVLGTGSKPYKVIVTLEGEALDISEAGTDVQFSDEGESFIIVDRSMMFRLVELKSFQTRELKLSSNSQDFLIYSFTFGSDN